MTHIVNGAAGNIGKTFQKEHVREACCRCKSYCGRSRSSDLSVS